MFSEEELRDIRGVTRGEDMVEVTCGCTSRTYGDSVGRLKIFLSGDLKIVCECVPGCPEGFLTFPDDLFFSSSLTFKVNVQVQTTLPRRRSRGTPAGKRRGSGRTASG